MKKASLMDAYRLFHEGSKVLARMEANGIRVDLKYLDKAIAETTEKIKTLESEVRSDRIFKRWKRVYGNRLKMNAKEQLATVLYDHLGFKYKGEKTATGKYKSDETTLLKVKDPFIPKYITLNKLKDDKTKYLEGIRREVDEKGYLHSIFNLAGGTDEDDGKGGTRTYRSSSSLLNFQNFPVRDPVRGALVRRSFIARRGHQIVEVDFSGIEVHVAYFYHLDPMMRKYLLDPTKDMHRDMAAECYLLKPEQISKHARYGGKNKFVFPQFYGDWYKDNAPDLWEWVDQANLKIEGTDKTIRKHLTKRGFRKLGACDPDESPVKGTFEYHIKEVQDRFWNEYFPVYRDWKQSWYKDYLEIGGIRFHTGFEVHGVYKRNDIINYPVQGAAFHCLLWCLIEIDKEMRKRKMRSVLVGQIHDSLVADVHVDELDEFLEIVQRITTIELAKAWKWIILPMKIEAEVAPIGGSWHDKKEIELEPIIGA